MRIFPAVIVKLGVKIDYIGTIVMLLVSLAAMSGCGKDEMEHSGRMILKTEGSDDSKTAVAGTRVYWVDGDQVRINSETPKVTVADGRAYVDVTTEGTIYGYFPSNIVRPHENHWKRSDPTIAVPSLYTCHYDDGKQVIPELPMVGMAAEGENQIMFKHVTAAILVRVRNTTGKSLRLDHVTVRSATQRLCGSVMVNLDATDLDLTAATTETVSEREVSVLFSDTPVIATGGSDIREIQVPILPIAATTNDLTIEVVATTPSGEHINVAGVAEVATLTQYTYSGTKDSPALPRNAIATAQIELRTTTPTSTVDGSLFSVAANKQVRFSKGNLQYIGSAATPYWRFAEHQYDVIGVMEQCVESNVIDRDLFGWGTSGYSSKNPDMISTRDSDYGNGDGVHISETEYDWGVHNTISDAGATGTWRTMTMDEWDYLLDGRTNAQYKHSYAQVNGVNGIIILPDHFQNSHNVDYVSMADGADEWEDNIYSASQWDYLEADGAVFLPLGGYRYGISTSQSKKDYGYYWMSTAYYENAYHLRFYKHINSQRIVRIISDEHRFLGMSVRLVRDAE